jgi:hypothetical protein
MNREGIHGSGELTGEIFAPGKTKLSVLTGGPTVSEVRGAVYHFGFFPGWAAGRISGRARLVPQAL